MPQKHPSPIHPMPTIHRRVESIKGSSAIQLRTVHQFKCDSPTLWACDLLTSTSTPYAAAWYQKTSLTFSDAIGAVRLQLGVGDINPHSPPHREPQIIPSSRLSRMANTLCFATSSVQSRAEIRRLKTDLRETEACAYWSDSTLQIAAPILCHRRPP